MKAIILSAGRGSRLLPLTADLPKCLLPVGLTTVLGLQLDILYECGIEEVIVVTGFHEHLVESEIKARPRGPHVSTIYNPFFQVADNLASCWIARTYMQEDFLLINGDTLFTEDLLQMVLCAPESDIAVTIDQKRQYDGDDMKVCLEGLYITGIGKTLTSDQTRGESIGILRFMGAGTNIFVNQLEVFMRCQKGIENWFLSVIHQLARSGVPVMAINIKGQVWTELDTPEDYEVCRALFDKGGKSKQRLAIAH